MKNIVTVLVIFVLVSVIAGSFGLGNVKPAFDYLIDAFSKWFDFAHYWKLLEPVTDCNWTFNPIGCAILTGLYNPIVYFVNALAYIGQFLYWFFTVIYYLFTLVISGIMLFFFNPFLSVLGAILLILFFIDVLRYIRGIKE